MSTYVAIILFLLFLGVVFVETFFHSSIIQNISEKSCKNTLKKIITLEICFFISGLLFLVSLFFLPDENFIKIILTIHIVVVLLYGLYKGSLIKAYKDLTVEPLVQNGNYQIIMKMVYRFKSLRFYLVPVDNGANYKNNIEISFEKYRELILMGKQFDTYFEEQVEIEKSYREVNEKNLSVRYLPNTMLAVEVKTMSS